MDDIERHPGGASISIATHERIVGELHQEIRAAMLGAMARRRLTDDEIGRIWFEARIPGLVEGDARRLIRAAEALQAEATR